MFLFMASQLLALTASQLCVCSVIIRSRCSHFGHKPLGALFPGEMWRRSGRKAPSPHPTDCPFATTAQDGRPEHPEDGGREKETVPVAVTALEVVGTLLKHLQDHEGDRVEIYRELESVLQGDDGRLPGGIVNRLIAEASSDMRAAQGVTDDMKTAASDVLVALARSHFHFVMSELQRHLKAMGKVPEEFVLLTLGKLSRSYALQCIPFVGMTLLALRAMLSQVGSGRILRTFCSVVEQWSKGVTAYFCSREQCPFPRSREARLCRDIYPVFRYVVANLLHCEEEEDKQAVLGAVTAMTVALLHGEQHGYHAWEPFLWLLQQYQEVRDTSQVTKNLSYLLETLEGLQSPIPQGLALAISSAVYCQALFLRLCDVTKEPGLGRKAVLSRCIVLLARTYPEETIAFLRCQLSSRSNAYRVAALGLLRELARSDDPATREQLPQLVEAVRSVCSNPSAQVQTAVVEFIRELLSSGSQSCQEWDVVGHIFNEFGRISGRLVAEGHLAWENPEEQALQALCMEIVGSLDVSLRGMTKLLWPRLLEYVVPAQYSGMLIPLSRCLRALVERQERAGHEEEEKPDAVNSPEQDGSPARLPTPQALLVRLLVLAAAPEKTGERAAAALRLLQALHGRIHRAVAAVWATEMPPLLQYLEGTTEVSLDSADWEERMLKFLRASLEPIEDGAWTVGLSQELSQQLGSSVPGSWEKLFLYKALGTALAACRDLGHVRGEVLRFLQEANPMELPEAQGMISVVSRAAENHFHLVLDTVTMFSSAFTGDWLCQTSTGWKLLPIPMREPTLRDGNSSRPRSWRLGELRGGARLNEELPQEPVQQQQNKERAQATCAALMHTYSSIALCAPKEQLLACVEKEIVGNILQLCGARERDWQLKLALVQSVTEVSSAIQAVGDCGSFELGLKQKVMWTLLRHDGLSAWWELLELCPELDWLEREPWDSLVHGVLQPLEKLSKLRPLLSQEDNRKLLAVCCHSVVSYPPERQKGRQAAKAAVNVQVLHSRCMQDLGHLIATLLEAEASSTSLDDVVDVLKDWLTSGTEWERERALWILAHVLGAYKERFELMRGRPWNGFGSLVGLLGTLTCDCVATIHQRPWLCLAYLLQIQAKTRKVVSGADEIRRLCEELRSPEPETLKENGVAIAKAICKYIPPAQARDFLTAVLDSLRHVRPTCVKAVWKWVCRFLVESTEEIVPEMPKILQTLYTYMEKSPHRPFSFRAVFFLTCSHREPAISCLLQKGLPMDGDTVELWRSLGRSTIGTRVLKCLAEKLNRVGNNCLQDEDSACERHSRHAALEAVTITHAISEVVLALGSTEELKRLLPHLLPSLLRWASETLGEERSLSPLSTWRELFLECGIAEEKPCRLFLVALEKVLGRCLADKWMQLLTNQAAWALLENPLCHPDGVTLLTSVLLRAELVSPCLMKNLSAWLNSHSAKLWVTAVAFFAELLQHYGVTGPEG
ncbi:maestro heat-like repeat-containing protein family member 2B [Opisthocomus hoazin]|uniref:maestro heat-like repeat-containing protein family member 2B n=1 Tax=Opisthocomus hoazin TaxID=30419 RepID=UPI003F530DC8